MTTAFAAGGFQGCEVTTPTTSQTTTHDVDAYLNEDVNAYNVRDEHPHDNGNDKYNPHKHRDNDAVRTGRGVRRKIRDQLLRAGGQV